MQQYRAAADGLRIVEEAVAAMKEGAFDFLQKPVDLEHLKLLVSARRSSRSCCARICCCAKNTRHVMDFRESWASMRPSGKSANRFRK